MNVCKAGGIFFFTLIGTIAASSLEDMSNTVKAIAAKKRTLLAGEVIEPVSIVMAGKKHLAVREKRSLKIFNIPTQTCIMHHNDNKKIYDHVVDIQGMHIAWLNQDSLILYNMKRQQEEWREQIKWLCRLATIAFHPYDNKKIVMMDPSMRRVTIHTKKNTVHTIALQGNIDTKVQLLNFVHHPTNTVIAYDLFTEYDYSARQYAAGQKTSISFMQQCYSDNGKMIAALTRKKLGMVSEVHFCCKTSDISYPVFTLEKMCIAMLFHPHNKYLFFLSDKGDVDCLNLSHRQWVSVASEQQSSNISSSENMQKRLAFSPRGTQLYIALNNKCVQIPVPLGVLYDPQELQKTFLCWLYLQNYGKTEKTYALLPQELLWLIIKKLLRLYRTT